MIAIKPFDYQPLEHENEKASNGYLMSVVALIAGLPIPIFNLLATFFFYLANRNESYFVRWHCTQALLAQFSLFFMNSVGFWWTVSVVFFNGTATNAFISYVITVLLFNLTEFIFTYYSAVKTRNGVHVEWWFYGSLTHLICKPEA
ncbi:MAG TPA: DUF4870 domain-containing protein [Cyclobacteriaceae bacterium]|nr:DUF4870 domain-containing protein [Cyclobacteriaceae bacterium]